MAKLFVSEAAWRCADRCVQVFGGRGYMRSNVAERFLRELRVDRIWEGTSEIQRLIVARGAGAPRRRRRSCTERAVTAPSSAHPTRPRSCVRARSRSSAPASAPGSYGDNVLRNLAAAGFEGEVWGINPKRDEVHGRPCVPSVAELPEPVDAVVVAIPAAGVAAVLAEAIERGCGGAIVLSAGFGEIEAGRRAGAGAARDRPRRRPAGLRAERQRDRLGRGAGAALGRLGRAARRTAGSR